VAERNTVVTPDDDMSKRKIFNDPIYGLIRFPFDSIYEVIDHPYFQRLRRISQQALSHYVYPGALHNRFQHAIGATHLMCRALDILRSKGTDITDTEYEASCLAILLHDIGHGPFSHALEHTLTGIHHEKISHLLIARIGMDLKKDFGLVMNIFEGTYTRKFFHQLVSGQIDVDRMDYLTRDSFFSGVAEGIIGYDRIILMMAVQNDMLVIEEKGRYSIEKFLMARRLMYLQVYLHKTVISAEIMLIAVLRRARHLVRSGVDIPSSDELDYFLKLDIMDDEDRFLTNFVKLDDMDILWMIKKSAGHPDPVFRKLCSDLLERRLLKVNVWTAEAEKLFWERRAAFGVKYNFTDTELEYFFVQKKETIRTYDKEEGEIHLLEKSGAVKAWSDVIPGMPDKDEELSFLFYPR